MPRQIHATTDSSLRASCVAVVGFALGLILWPLSATVYAIDKTQRLVEFKTQIEPLLREHCYACHSGAEADAGLALDHFDTPLSLLKGRSVWEKAVQRMQIEEMPPPDSSELSDADRKRLVDWITLTVNDLECGLAPNPGKVTLRRLNATEYQNTIRDLLGIYYEPAADFPGDDVGYGFDNIGDVLSLSPILMEKYLLAAEAISREAIQTPPVPPTHTVELKGEQLEAGKGAHGANGSLLMTSNVVVKFEDQVPWAGKYTLTITASGDQAGSEACRMGVAVDGKFLRQIGVPNERSEPREFELPLRLRPGKRTIEIGFLNDFYREASGGGEKLDRNLIVHHVSLVGKKPAERGAVASGQLSAIHKAIIFDSPRNDAEAEKVTGAVISRLASRAYRRPLEPDELQRLVGLSLSIQEDGDSFEESIQVALQAMLVSPKFLFRVEPPSTDAGFQKYADLDEFELATRISYFLWSTMPDAELFSLAWKKQLRQSDNLERQVQRMLRDPRSNAFVQNFASQWLTLRKLRTFQPNPELYPSWNVEIRQLAARETLTFFAGVMREDLSIMKLLDADFTYLNETLANYYGIPGVKGDQFRRVSLQGTPRSGLLTQASVLAVTSNPTRTSPVKRGKWILDNLLATPPPPAPAGVPELDEKGELVGTLREQLEQHRKDPGCAGCHKLMDPLGFALEKFDAVGRYRELDGQHPIDSSGELPDGTQVDGAMQLRDVLITKNQEKFAYCLTEKMMTYALGRGLEYYDKCAVDQVVEQLRNSDYRFSALVLEIVKSDPFQKKGEREIEL